LGFLTALLIAAGLALFELIVWHPVTRRRLPLGWLGHPVGARRAEEGACQA